MSVKLANLHVENTPNGTHKYLEGFKKCLFSYEMEVTNYMGK